MVGGFLQSYNIPMIRFETKQKQTRCNVIVFQKTRLDEFAVLVSGQSSMHLGLMFVTIDGRGGVVLENGWMWRNEGTNMEPGGFSRVYVHTTLTIMPNDVGGDDVSCRFTRLINTATNAITP